MNNLGGRQNGRLSMIVKRRGDLDDISANNLQAFEALDDSQEFPRRPPTSLGGPRRYMNISQAQSGGSFLWEGLHYLVQMRDPRRRYRR